MAVIFLGLLGGLVSRDVLPSRVVEGPVKVRLVGVDTPETVHPSKAVQHYGKEAGRFAANVLKGEHVYLAYEGDTRSRDRYGRIPAQVYPEVPEPCLTYLLASQGVKAVPALRLLGTLALGSPKTGSREGPTHAVGPRSDA